MSFTVGAGLLFTSLLISNTVIRAFAETNNPAEISGLLAGPAYLAVSTWLVSFLALVTLYRFLPNTHVQVKNVLFGALIASLAFEIAKGSFFYYTRDRADVTPVYGEFTSVAVLLGWLYLSAAIVLIGGLIASIHTRLVEQGVVSQLDIWTLGLAPALAKVRRRFGTEARTLRRLWPRGGGGA